MTISSYVALAYSEKPGWLIAPMVLDPFSTRNEDGRSV